MRRTYFSGIPVLYCAIRSYQHINDIVIMSDSFTLLHLLNIIFWYLGRSLTLEWKTGCSSWHSARGALKYSSTKMLSELVYFLTS